MNLDKREAELAKQEEQGLERIKQIRLSRISIALLRGNVKDAEKIAASMPDRADADNLIADWKKQYKGTPHGQWDGGV